MSLCYSQLTLSDRRRLHQLVERKVPVGEIARQLGRHRSTIYRELKRNTFHDAEFPEYSGYYSGIANEVVGPPRRTPTIGKMRSASKGAPDMVESAGDGRPRRG